MSSIIIGNGTTVSFYGACVISANWGYNPNTQRLYCIGNWEPQYQYDRPTETLSIVIYSGTGGPIEDVSPMTACGNPSPISASVSPAACGESVDNIPEGTGSPPGGWAVTSYGFSKDDPLLPGQETWGLQRWVEGSEGDIPVPTYVIRGIAEGQGTYLATDADPGIVFTGTLSYSQAGNVTANGIGRNDRLRLGAVIQIGGSESPASGKIGQGSVSVPYTPLWI